MLPQGAQNLRNVRSQAVLTLVAVAALAEKTKTGFAGIIKTYFLHTFLHLVLFLRFFHNSCGDRRGGGLGFWRSAWWQGW